MECTSFQLYVNFYCSEFIKKTLILVFIGTYTLIDRVKWGNSKHGVIVNIVSIYVFVTTACQKMSLKLCFETDTLPFFSYPLLTDEGYHDYRILWCNIYGLPLSSLY